MQDIALDEIWNCINKWAESESLAFKSSQVVSGNGRRHYVRSLMKESLLSPSHLQKFCIIFEKGGLAPKVNIEMIDCYQPFVRIINTLDYQLEDIIS